MMHYTPLDPAYIWSNLELAPAKMEERILDGVRVLLQQENQGWRIVQIISTNPDDYLRSDLQPGNQIEYIPVVKPQKNKFPSFS